MQYTLRALFAGLTVVAFACFVVFVAPPLVRIAVLIVATLALPGPLAVLMRHGDRNIQAFAVGGLAAYAAWLIIGGAPCAYLFAYELKDATNSLSEVKFLVESCHVGYIGLYVPWISVPVAGTVALLGDWLLLRGHVRR